MFRDLFKLVAQRLLDSGRTPIRAEEAVQALRSFIAHQKMSFERSLRDDRAQLAERRSTIESPHTIRVEAQIKQTLRANLPGSRDALFMIDSLIDPRG